MTETTYTDLRQRLASVLDRVANDHEVVIVRRKGEKIVLMAPELPESRAMAEVTRALFFDLVALGEVREQGGARMFGICSAGEFFLIAPEETIKGIA